MQRRYSIIILSILVLAIGIFIGYYAHGKNGGALFSSESGTVKQISYQESGSGNERQTNDDISNSRRNAITRTVAMATPAVVGITVTEVREYRDPWLQFFGDDPFFRRFGTRRYEAQSAGSGFLISPDGYILTNDHVAGNAKKIIVTMTNGEKYDAELVGHDVVSDVAVIKVKGTNFSYLKLGNSDDVMVGEWVIAFGNPFGLFFEVSDKPYVTVGVVSYTNMRLSSEDNRRVYRNMIGTDASINSGNSGGPLVNSQGEVIGINTIIFTPNQGNVGLGFAIPINKVKTILDELKVKGAIDRDFWVGFRFQTLDQQLARYYGLKRAEGVIVTDVERGSPAAKSGLKVGDVITEINGERVADDDGILGIFHSARTGDELKLKVYRDDSFIELTMKLVKRG
jgi:serine protease Do